MFEQAQRVYHFALACAEEAGNWPLRGEILSSMAKHAIRAGRPDEGLTLAGQGLVRADRLTVVGRSLLHTDRGRALARMRRIEGALTAIGTAGDHFAHFTPDNELPFWAFYNPARHDLLTLEPSSQGGVVSFSSAPAQECRPADQPRWVAQRRPAFVAMPLYRESLEKLSEGKLLWVMLH